MSQIRIVIRSESDRCIFSKDHAAIIDVEGICQLPSGSGGNKLVQIQHRTIAFAQECMQERSAVRGTTDNLAMRIQTIPTAAWVAVHRSQLPDFSVLPDYGVVYSRLRQIG